MTELEPHATTDATARMEQQLREANERLARLEAAFREVNLLAALQHGPGQNDPPLRSADSPNDAENLSKAWRADEPAIDGNREAETYFQRGVALCQSGKFNEAVAAWREVLRLQPDNAYALANIGVVFTEQARWPEARDMFTRVLALKPNNSEAHYGLGMAYAQMGDYPAAAASLENTLRLQPDNADARYNLGLVRQRLAQDAASRRPSDQGKAAQIKPEPVVPPPPSGPFAPPAHEPRVEERASTFVTTNPAQTGPSQSTPPAGTKNGHHPEPLEDSEPETVPIDRIPAARRPHWMGAGVIAVAAVALVGFLVYTNRHPSQERKTGAGVTQLPPQASKSSSLVASSALDTQPLPMPVIETPLVSMSPEPQATVQANSAQPGKMQVRLDNGLSGRFRYWFVSSGDHAAAMKPLPAPARNGIITIPIPAAYNQPGAQLRVMNVAQGKVARVPIMDVSHHTLLVSPNVGPNLLQNADFTQGINGWRMETVPPAHASMQIMDGMSTPAGVSGRAVHFDVAAVGAQNWSVQCLQPGVNLSERTPYVISFWAKSDRHRPLRLDAILDKADWHRIGAVGAVNLTQQWHKYMLPFLVAQTQPSHSQISFILGEAVGSVDIAGVTLRRSLGNDTAASLKSDTAVTISAGDFN